MVELFTEQCALYATCFVFGLLAGYKLKKPFQAASNVLFKEPTKLVLVVREDLKLGKGKMVAQCCHGTLLAYINSRDSSPKLLQQWELSGQPKVVVKVKNLEEFSKVQEDATSLGVCACVVRDAGKTQVSPGTLTVLAVGPDIVSNIDKVTSHLKLL